VGRLGSALSLRGRPWRCFQCSAHESLIDRRVSSRGGQP
jgi:hypothetical protein